MTKVCACIFIVFLTTAVLHSKCDVEIQSDGHCNKWGITFDQGQKVSVPQQCAEATCTDASQNEISLRSCPQYKIREECHLTNENLKLPYPDCCPKPVCPPGLD